MINDMPYSINAPLPAFLKDKKEPLGILKVDLQHFRILYGCLMSNKNDEDDTRFDSSILKRIFIGPPAGG